MSNLDLGWAIFGIICAIILIYVAIQNIYSDIKNKIFWKMFKKNGKEFLYGSLGIIVVGSLMIGLVWFLGWVGNLVFSWFK